MAQLAIKLTTSMIGRTAKQKGTIESLGLKKVGQTVIHEDTPEVRGKIKSVDFMLDVEEVD